MPPAFSATPEGRFLDEAIGVIKSINARTNLLIHEYEQIKKAIPPPDKTAEPESKKEEL